MEFHRLSQEHGRILPEGVAEAMAQVCVSWLYCGSTAKPVCEARSCTAYIRLGLMAIDDGRTMWPARPKFHASWLQGVEMLLKARPAVQAWHELCISQVQDRRLACTRLQREHLKELLFAIAS